MEGILGVDRKEKTGEKEREGKEETERREGQRERERNFKKTWKPFKDFNQGRYTGRFAV